ncbi:MAG: MFS transporter, partial [Methanomicrobiales archaeon]
MSDPWCRGAAALQHLVCAYFATTPPEDRGRSMGYLGTTVAIGSSARPIVGGFVVDSLGRQYIFFINIPIGILLIIAAAAYLQIDEKRVDSSSLDWHGSAAMVAMFAAMSVVLGCLAVSGRIAIVALL